MSNKTKGRAQDQAEEFLAGLDVFQKKRSTDSNKSKTKADIPAPSVGSKKHQPLIRKLPVLEIDPKRCKPWIHHNRDESWLSTQECDDLIKSISSHGQQEPALVRETEGDPDHDYEIIYGVRRWFSCSQIPNQRLLARCTKADDRECMVLMHFENFNSKDISELERARSFKLHIESGIFKSQKDLAEEMHLTVSSISKSLLAASIYDYEWLVDSLPSIKKITLRKALKLAPFLKDKYSRDAIKLKVKEIKKRGEPPKDNVIDVLLLACSTEEEQKFNETIDNLKHLNALKYKIDTKGRLNIQFLPKVKRVDMEKAKEALSEVLDSFCVD